ncbi:hypothetical protein [Flavobacterium sp. GSB-24]|uniref:hypothetical protein n=1 Tax=Flavobacterium sp. GSB-24 TaxID=2994319 RepID=UPI00248F527A|nr:hypothetical protein [Flavobacterium sp. GSB-24]BDU27308.1 hypothetical protein FLGSB24_40520 [Flavobacterium sp. GSB-24]
MEEGLRTLLPKISIDFNKINMNLKKIKVYHLFWFVAVLVAFIALVSSNYPNSSLDINISDTYFVISNYHLAIVLFFSYLLMGLGYWLVLKILNKQLFKLLTIIHTLILIGSFLFYWIVVVFGKLHLNNRTYNYFDDFELINITLVSEFLIIIFVATPIYIINLLIGIFRKSKTEMIQH